MREDKKKWNKRRNREINELDYIRHNNHLILNHQITKHKTWGGGNKLESPGKWTSCTVERLKMHFTNITDQIV